MAKIILSLNDIPQGEFELGKERMTIGRKAENDIPIDNLAISGQHALILSVLDDSFIEDLGSTNGTYVNGKLVKKQGLRNGDIIGIGKHELKYINEHAIDDDDDFEKTVLINPANDKIAAMSAKFAEDAGVAAVILDTGNPTAPSMPKGKLHLLNGPIAGKEHKLTKALITLGKPGVQVAVISRRPQGYFLLT